MALGRPKALDSVYITVRLLEDKEKFGLPLSEDDYNAFLRMVKLSYYRTRWLNEKIRRCVFVTQVALFNKYFQCFHGKAAQREMKIEKALTEEDYRQYLRCCEA